METYAQHSIKHCINMIAPFEASKQQEEDGQLQFYQFMVSLYHGMYERPEEYLVFPKPYEEYMAKRKGQEAQGKEKQHSSDSRESTLRNTFQQAIQFYALYLYHIGVKSEGIDKKTGSLVIRKGDYTDVLEQMGCIHEVLY